jgi:methionyl-tRNA formyltransferase
VRTVFLGSGAFAVPTFRALAGHPLVDLVAVVSAPPRPAGRKADLRPTPVAQAVPDGVPLLIPERLRAPESLAEIGARRPELVVLADYGQIVPAPLLELEHGALNLHPSLLPRHRGASPVQATILAGDRETGVTLMRMDPGLDTGDVIAVERLALAGDERAPELERRLASLAADLLARSLEPWLAGDLRPHPQPVEGATLTRPLRREDGRLDPARSATELERQVRAYDPWPGTFVETTEGRLAILDAEVRTEDDPGPGIGRFDATGLGTSDGTLRLRVVQPASGGRMSWDAFRRGHPGIVGSAVVASTP